ncbi:hypothetical protein PF005_g1365 [Phytophthora fragariae]|uniref:Uncharacterized protein n=2 Tax=Phytophthora fragariae TaxID=53985 RepID=A0A6A4AJ37_9STRA|nr:hypothetical protein PF003_g20887 [Phytophthora fragariae]KAE8949040.1 hypothetical protein PF009_g1395 [Phytophthora fragariae]KAE9029882.1 hypothetical protein PF011_g864 [Phytophthora fragariae]KAE9138506.1 hypothetical protein PF007_g1366 [Phytophthora fragariae]KAE9154897.1 hypothetical protein PF006_g1103 [Phytophthora fragariae]
MIILATIAYAAIMFPLGFLFASGHWLYLTVAILVPIWYMTMPYYVELESRCQWRIQNALDSIEFTMHKLSLRLWFVWLTAAVSFSVLDVLQLIHGDYFSFRVYASLMGLFIAMAIAAYIQTRDPVVTWVATWFLVGLAWRETELKGDAKETFEKLQAVALVIGPIFVVVLFLDSIQGFYDFFKQFVPRSDVSRDTDGPPNAVSGTA